MGCADYWTISLRTKSFYEVDAEKFVFFWPLSSRVARFPAFQCLRFHRIYLFIAVFLIQFFCGSLYAIFVIANPMNVYFGFDANGNEATTMLFAAGACSIASQALLGPLLERQGPRRSMTVSIGLLALGLVLAQTAVWTRTWALLHAGCYLLAIAFGAMTISSMAAALKWCPDLRGTVTGCCIFGYGLGTGLARSLLHALLNNYPNTLRWTFGISFAVAIPLLSIATLVLRTPPSDFSVRGHDMHCIPLETAPNADMVHDEFLRVGMTLVNYSVVGGIEGTDRQYHEQVRALTLPQCILSTDFVCLYIAFAANALVGLIYNDMLALRVDHDLLVEWCRVSSAKAASIRFYGLLVDLGSRMFVPMLSDACIRLFYANPAVVRKFVLVILLLVPCVALPTVYFHSANLAKIAYIEGLLYTVQLCASGGAALIVCFLADMYGVYHVGTMYGLLSTSWGLDRALLGLAPLNVLHDLTSRLGLVWYCSLAGLFLMLFVRTDSKDRFYRGYQLTVCGKVLVQRPARRQVSDDLKIGMMGVSSDPPPQSFFLWDSARHSLSDDDVLLPTPRL
ncbi:hypothetical protein SPRG_15635 [Saprolegnia parasitica CBS 223.65]|uniref:Major facilitator superfamily (MFS) profile domain-containing protein n=1 Tax=Saprolegnia parasitica (strain CBS 223.65) TaxID=695850 RepID=A0A067BXD3_SAPPC|nr:hypothetical protein SPRG_15635 [Saprolegnia parasitica CBS 223.65]KDO19192.1 hypothetical protein SPRG_15635 [Saprolegnia parasitica CBS 223.65]|eukprot:XP_012210092.1 hypothetical protein SPRG_15635 [Saprolegnia parasitica CBS 223.65]